MAQQEADAGTAVRVVTLAITSFRNIESARLELQPSGMVVIGRNGQGKTNLLEALYYLHLLRSFRGARDVDVAQFEAVGFHLNATTAGTPRAAHEISIGFDSDARRKRIRVNGRQPPRMSEAYGAVPTVLCSPDDRELIAGSPAARRRYLDVMLSTISPRYLFALQQYRSALLQRNAALRELARGRGNEGGLAVWEPALAAHGAVITDTRAEWVRALAGEFSHLCTAIGEVDAVTLEYASRTHGADTRTALAERLEATRSADVRRGVTHTGPHRDELRLTMVGTRELREFASAGQQRTAALALRMLESETMRRTMGSHPLLLLDDPFAELDRDRTTRILTLLREIDPGQTVLCVPRADDVPAELAGLEQWSMESGRLHRLPRTAA